MSSPRAAVTLKVNTYYLLHWQCVQYEVRNKNPVSKNVCLYINNMQQQTCFEETVIYMCLAL